MMPGRAPTPCLPRPHDHGRCAAATSSKRPRQGRRDPRTPPSARRAATPARRTTGPAPPGGPGPSRRPATPGPPTVAAPAAAAGPSRHDPTLAPSAPRPPPRDPVTSPPPRAARARCARSESWSFAPPAKILTGATGDYTANCSPSASRPPRRRCGRSCATPASTPPPTALQPPGRRSSARRPKPCSPLTFIETVTVTGVRLYILAAIEHATRRVRISAPHLWGGNSQLRP